MIVTNFHKLFSIEWLHDHYRDPGEILRDVNIVPDDATGKLLKGYQLVVRKDRNILFCYVRTRTSVSFTGGKPKVDIINKPLVNFDEKVVLKFNIGLNASRFFESSNLGSFYSSNLLLALGNESGNKVNALLSLSKRIPAYNSATAYFPGMLVVNGSNQTFIALKESGPGNVRNTASPGYWKHISDAVPYVSQSDLIPRPKDEMSFATLSVSFRKSLLNDFSLLKKSNSAQQNDLILGKDYSLHFLGS